MGYVGTAPLSGDFRKLDDISSGFNGSTTGFTLQVGSVNVTPPKETTLLISVGGILQEPITAYTVSGSTITFTAAPESGADFFGVMLGEVGGVGTPANDSVGADQIVDDAIDSEHYTDASIDFAHIQNVAANSVLGRNANSTGVLSEVALATTQILIGDGTGFTAAALSGDATMSNAGVVAIASDVIVNADIKSDAAIDISKLATITLSTNTSGDFVQNITAGTGLTSTGATSGENIAHSLSVDAAQTGITSLGTQAADFIVGNGYGMVVGHTAQVTVASVVQELQVLGTNDGTDSGMTLGRWGGGSGGVVNLVHSRNGTIGSNTVTTDGDEIGRINFIADNGTNLNSPSSDIVVVHNGSFSSAVPTDMIFSTSSASTVSLEALRIDSNQDTSIPLGKKFAFDTGVGDTYIYQESADDLHIVVGGVAMMQFDQDGGGAGEARAAFGSDATIGGRFAADYRFNWTSDGSSTTSRTHQFSGALTGASGDTDWLTGVYIAPSTITQTASESIGVISTLHLYEPQITDNLTGDITVATTLYIETAPTEGETNAAIYVASGNIQAAAGQVIATTPRAQNGLTLVNSTDSQTMTLYPDTATTMTWYYGGAALSVNSSSNVSLTATKKLHFDSFGDTYIYQESGDDLHVVVGGVAAVQIDQDAGGSGIMGIGIGAAAAPVDYAQLRISGNYTTGNTAAAIGTYFDSAIIGISGMTGNLAGVYLANDLTTQTATESISTASLLYLRAPTITDNLTGAITVSSTLYIAGEPTSGVGTTNAAIYVASGDIRAEGGIGIGEAPSANNVISIQKNQAAFTEINIGNTNASGSSGIRLGSSVASGVFTSNSSSAIPSGGVGVVNTTGIYTDSTSLDISFGTGTTEQMRIDTGTGTVFVGGGSFTAHTEANDLVVGSTSGRNGMTIVSGTSSGDKASIFFADSGGTYRGMIRYNNNDDSMGIATADTDAIFIDSIGRVFLGDSSNGDATGPSLTIKGVDTTGYDTIALKDTYVNHGGGGASIENDTWFKIRRARASDSGGGAYLVAISENVATPDAVFSFLALGNTADTTKTSSASGMYTFRAREHDNANTINDLTANGNHTAFIGRVGDAERALFLIDEDGDYWYDGADGGAFDDDWDAGLIRAAQIATTANPAQIIRTKFDQLVEYDQDALKLRGLLGGAITGSRDEGAINGLLNGAQWNRVFMGAIWQQEVKHMSLAEKVEGLEVELIEAKKQLAAISA